MKKNIKVYGVVKGGQVHKARLGLAFGNESAASVSLTVWTSDETDDDEEMREPTDRVRTSAALSRFERHTRHGCMATFHSMSTSVYSSRTLSFCLFDGAYFQYCQNAYFWNSIKL